MSSFLLLDRRIKYYMTRKNIMSSSHKENVFLEIFSLTENEFPIH